MVRTVGGIAAGVVAAFVTVAVIEYVGHIAFPFASEGEMAVQPALEALPLGIKVIVVLAWFAGALVGGALAARISGTRWTAWAVGGLVALAGIANIFLMPHPVWMQIAAVVAPLLGGILAGHFTPRAREEAGADL